MHSEPLVAPRGLRVIVRLLAALVPVLVALAMASPSHAQGPCTAINFGAAPTAASIGAAGETDCYTFTGAADGEIRIRIAETSGTLITSTSVLRPNSSVVCAATTATEQTCSLDAAGTHTINVVDNTATKTGNYSISVQRLNSPVGCTALTFGAAPTTASIVAAAEMDCYTFTGAIGDRIRLRTVRTSGTMSAVQEVVRPNGSTVCTPSGAQEVDCALDAAGTHRIIMRDSGGTLIGDYSTGIQRLNSPVGCTALAFGAAPMATNIAAAGEMDCYSFSASAGDQIRVRVNETAGSLVAIQEMIWPDGTTPCSATSAAELTCSIDTTGTHRVIVHDNNGTFTGNYSISVQKLNAPTGCTALTYGAAPTATSISAAGEVDCYTVNAAPGRRIRIRVVKTSGTLSHNHDVVDSDGSVICTVSGATDSDCVLDSSGTSRIFLRDSTGTNTGNYSIAVQRLDAPVGCTALVHGAAPTTASIGAAAEMDCYSFTSAAGDRIRIRAPETSGTLINLQEVLRANGTAACSATSAMEISCSVGAGAHRIIVRDNSGPNTGNYSIAVQRLNNPTGCTALTFGAAPTASNIGNAAEMDCYSFNGVAGSPVRIRAVKTSGTLVATQEVVRPNGSTLCTPSGAQDVTCTPDSTGVHRVILRDSNGTETGNYSLSVQRLNAPTGCTALTFGAAPTTASITPVGEMDCFSFTAAPGDQIRIRGVETNGSLVTLSEVLRPNGSTLCAATTAAEGTCTVDTGGAHRIIVRDNSGTNTGDYSVAVQRLNNPLGCTALTYGAAPTGGSIADAAETDCYTFTGNAGDTIRTRMVKLSGTMSPVQEVVGPSGETVCTQTGAADANCVLETTGGHRILVKDSAGTLIGNYAIGVQKLNNPTGCTALTFGAAPTTAGLAAQAETDCYSFTGAAGDRIRLRSAETSGAMIALQEVIAPDGSTQCFATTALDVSCTLESAGTHRILVRDNSGTNTGNYSTAIQRLNDPVGCTALAFGPSGTASSIGVAAEMDCYTFAGTAGDRIRIRMTKTSGTISPLQELLRPNGGTVCTPTGTQDVTCQIGSTGTFKLLVRDGASGTNTGDYVIGVQRLNSPTGCTALTIGAPATAGSISANSEMDCFTVTATAGQPLTVQVNETSGTLVAQQEIRRPNGDALAGPTTAQSMPATAIGGGVYKIIVEDSLGTRTGNYNVAVSSP